MQKRVRRLGNAWNQIVNDWKEMIVYLPISEVKIKVVNFIGSILDLFLANRKLQHSVLKISYLLIITFF